jgi:hypothetical protein
MRIIVTEYTLMGCRHDDGVHFPVHCRHHQQTTVKETVEQGRDPAGRLSEPYVWRQITPECARIDEHAERRAEIYARAQAASDAVIVVTSDGKMRHGAMRRRAIVWEQITSEFKHQPCPFFEPQNET